MNHVPNDAIDRAKPFCHRASSTILVEDGLLSELLICFDILTALTVWNILRTSYMKLEHQE
jgi:hypothetical protein